jgi:hypothetical protein
MIKIIKNLRNQPEEIKTTVLYIFISLSAVVLMTIFVRNSIVNNNQSNIQTKKEASPLSALKDNFVDGFKSVKERAPW